MYFGLLLVLEQVGVAESEKRVAAIFLLPVWALEPPKRSFRPYSGSYGCLVADRRPKIVAQSSTPTTQSVKEYHLSTPISLFVHLSLKLGPIVKNSYLENRESNFHQIFRVFWGSTADLESVKISGSDSGILREGVGKKKV